jgi:hypothetical protein
MKKLKVTFLILLSPIFMDIILIAKAGQLIIMFMMAFII